MSKLSDVVNGAIQSLLGTRNLAKTTLAITTGGGAATFKSAALSYLINGVFKAANALAAQSMAITAGNGPAYGAIGYVQPVSKTVYYTVSIDAAGTVTVTQGTYAGQIGLDDTTGSAMGDGSIPLPPAGNCAIGVIKIVTDSTHTFTPGTTNLDATGVTASYFDVAVLPSGTL